jgi:hypothetical protein
MSNDPNAKVVEEPGPCPTCGQPTIGFGLNPCPFCGSKPQVFYNEKTQEARIVCKCGIATGTILGGREAIVEICDRWNKRVTG